MAKTVIAIHVTLTRAGHEDIDLLVYKKSSGKASLYGVYTNFVEKVITGTSLEDAFQGEVKKHDGYVIGEGKRADLLFDE